MRAFRVAYDGRDFRGFQRQPDVHTVENTLAGALGELGIADGDDVPPEYAAAGRTDAGVSALAQTVAFECPAWCTPRALNSALPASVRAWAHADVAPDFHATHDAVERTYRYYLHAPDASLDRARTVTARLSGEHDVHNLTPDARGTTTARTLSLDVRNDGEFLVLTASAGGFPREFVRRLATLVELVATGEREPSFLDQVLDSEPLSGPEGVGPAPAEPLVLLDVAYPGVEFVVDGDAAESARGVFAERRRRGLENARVSEALLDGLR